MSGWWYLSFAGEVGFMGAAIVEADCIACATSEAWLQGCNPGGEAIGTPIPSDLLARHVPMECRNVLLDMGTMEKLGWMRPEAFEGGITL